MILDVAHLGSADYATALEIAKYASIVAGAVFGALGIAFETRDKNSGRLNRWGVIALLGIAVSLIIGATTQGLESRIKRAEDAKADQEREAARARESEALRRLNSLLGQTDMALVELAHSDTTQQRILSKSEASVALGLNTAQRQAGLLRAQQAVHLSVLRSQYPLEPMGIDYDMEYSMSDPGVAPYTRRVRADIVAYLRREREGRGVTYDDLHNEDVLFVISNEPRWMPGSVPGEETARALLTSDETSFRLTRRNGKDSSSIVLLSVPESMAEVLVTLPRHGRVTQKVELNADFQRGVFIKHVRADSLARAGKDNTVFSVVDLIGRTLTWNTWSAHSHSPTITSIQLRFPFDYADPRREIRVNPAATSILVTPQMVGLRGLADAIFEK